MFDSTKQGVRVGGKPIQQNPIGPISTESGNYSVLAGPTLFNKDMLHLPVGLAAGLLTSPPKPEGDGFVELAVPGYDRQPVTFIEGAVDWVNDSLLSWQVIDLWPVVTHVGIFTFTGDLLFYGRLRAQPGSVSKDVFALPKSALKIRRPSRFNTLPLKTEN